jgi:MFS family permease
MRERFSYVVKALFSRQYLKLFIPLSLLYLIMMYFVYDYMYQGEVLHFYETFSLWYAVSFSILTIVISILFGALLTLIVMKFREVKKKSLGVGTLGIFIGSLTAGCPGCVFGLFPLFAGIFGFGAGTTIAIMPLNGIELQLLTILLFVLSILFLSKEVDLTCKV